MTSPPPNGTARYWSARRSPTAFDGAFVRQPDRSLLYVEPSWLAHHESSGGGTMPTPALSLQRQMLRRRPVSGAPIADGASDHLQRSLGTFLLTMFGVGETVGAGIFIVLSQSVPQAGPAVVISFLLAGIAAGLAAVCYAEMASAVPVS